MIGSQSFVSLPFWPSLYAGRKSNKWNLFDCINSLLIILWAEKGGRKLSFKPFKKFLKKFTWVGGWGDSLSILSPSIPRGSILLSTELTFLDVEENSHRHVMPIVWIKYLKLSRYLILSSRCRLQIDRRNLCTWRNTNHPLHSSNHTTPYVNRY